MKHDRGFVNWKTKIVLNWQKDSKGYRIERDTSDDLYIVANGGEPDHYTAYAFKDDILFDLANVIAYPFGRLAGDGTWEAQAEERAVIRDRVLKFARAWGLLNSTRGHRKQPYLEFL